MLDNSPSTSQIVANGHISAPQRWLHLEIRRTALFRHELSGMVTPR
jgi:hypothetical protein